MKCQVCGKRTFGLPDVCPSCGGQMMAMWNSWYRYPLYIGIAFVLLAVPGIYYYGAHDHDIVRAAYATFQLVLGFFFVFISAIMRSRHKKTGGV